MEKEEKIKKADIKVRKKFEKVEEFKSHYVTGAIGGFKNKYDFRLSFYNTDTNSLIEKLQNMQSDKEIGKEELIEETQDLELRNNIVCEVIMSEPAIRELYQFIGRQLKEKEKIEEKIFKESDKENSNIILK
ncbi:MAG: hypothetical protein R6U96_19420 [Promethearchaeia archaeon]